MKDVPNLQGTYFSEPVNGTYYTLGIQSVDHDGGKIVGLFGKGRFLGHSLSSGWLQWYGEASTIYLNMVFDKCNLRSDDKTFNRLYGTVSDIYDQEIHPIVFNKNKDEIVDG
ncbi:hypothetical protein HX823_04795 [Pseudomonas sp. P7759]|uniref:hypothetical protein n=1 Tax=Pseudomonas sp. P7759 TaxID=2738831 RepID=UPI0015A3AB3A|nr:hypothetical protein [Pseudomonas sp. P7759]NWC73392.1 hypothetical protein [Pseudomonas sp. P7759]